MLPFTLMMVICIVLLLDILLSYLRFYTMFWQYFSEHACTLGSFYVCVTYVVGNLLKQM